MRPTRWHKWMTAVPTDTPPVPEDMDWIVAHHAPNGLSMMYHPSAGATSILLRAIGVSLP